MKRPFYHYGEGSISHGGDGTCDCLLKVEWGSHPMIHRSEWPNRRAYLRHAMSQNVMHWSFGKIRTKNIGMDDWKPVLPGYVTLITRLSRHLFGDPLRRDNLTYLPVHPTQSIYGDKTEEAIRWQERRDQYMKEHSDETL